MHKNFRLVMLVSALLSAVLTACGGASDLAAAAQGITVSVTPDSAAVGQLESFTVAATVTGTADTAVDWSVEEGSGGGTVTEEGLYTAPSANGTYHVAAVSRADPTKRAAAVVTVSGQPPVRDGAPMTTANRTSGVAPLVVFFDAVDETADSRFLWRSGVVQPADREASQYVWDFGDLAAGVWTQTGNSRNGATGFTAAHVYETPGTYTVTLSVREPSGVVSTYAQTITVSAFSGTTYYVAANGSDSNDGLSPATPFATFGRGFTAVNGGSNRRLLLRRGDTFSTPGVTVTASGPGMIGAYGDATRNRPVVNVTGTGGGIIVRARDWRIVDLDLVGPGTGVDQGAGVGYSDTFQTTNALVLRVRAANFRVGLGNGHATNIYETPHDGNAWVESEVPNSNSSNMYVGGRRLAILGCNIHDSPTHALRVWQAYKAVISNNRFWHPGLTRQAIKLHSTGEAYTSAKTKWVTISDNRIRGPSAPSGTSTWSVSIGAEDDAADQRPAHIVIERNRFTGSATSTVELMILCSDVFVRNNVFDGTGAGPYFTGVHVTHRGAVVPVANNVRVYHNTVQRDAADRSTKLTGVRVSEGVTNVIVRGNLVSPGGAVGQFGVNAAADEDYGAAGAGFVQDHNVTTLQPRFANPAAFDFSLQPGSPGVDAGGTNETRDDFRRRARPLGNGYDAGAYESQ